MKKIKSIQQLKAEKKRLLHRQAELETRIRGQWSGLKANLKPGVLLKEAFNRPAAMSSETGSDNLLKSTISYGLSLLSKKITEKAGDKIADLFKKKKK
jgi:hypothetical protein